MGKKGRKNGCPVNIRNWVVSILDVATQQFVRIYGLTSLTRTIEGETEDGSADTDIWAEPYITKRSSSCDLEGDKKVIEATGEVDPGQEMLNEYAEMSGCDSDCTLKFVDPYGHGWIADYVVTSAEESSDDSDNSVTWSLEGYLCGESRRICGGACRRFERFQRMGYVHSGVFCAGIRPIGRRCDWDSENHHSSGRYCRGDWKPVGTD